MITLEKLLEFKKEQEESMTLTTHIERLKDMERSIDDYCKYQGITRHDLFASRVEYEKEMKNES